MLRCSSIDVLTLEATLPLFAEQIWTPVFLNAKTAGSRVISPSHAVHTGLNARNVMDHTN